MFKWLSRTASEFKSGFLVKAGKELKKQPTQVILVKKLLETVFLGILVLALAIGNAFLSLTDPRKLQRKVFEKNKRLIEGGLPGNPVQEGFESDSVQEGFESDSAQSFEGDSVQGSVQLAFGEAKPANFGKPAEANSFELHAEKERVLHLSKRISRMENLLLKLDNSKFVAQKINGTNLGQKLSDFEEFKQNTGLEIAALKQRLDKIQPVKGKKNNVTNISDEKLRRLVFRTSN